MDFDSVPIGFGMALSQNEAAMIRYGQLPEAEKEELLTRARDIRSEIDMYKLVASLANGFTQSNTL